MTTFLILGNASRPSCASAFLILFFPEIDTTMLPPATAQRSSRYAKGPPYKVGSHLIVTDGAPDLPPCVFAGAIVISRSLGETRLIFAPADHPCGLAPGTRSSGRDGIN